MSDLELLERACLMVCAIPVVIACFIISAFCLCVMVSMTLFAKAFAPKHVADHCWDVTFKDW